MGHIRRFLLLSTVRSRSYHAFPLFPLVSNALIVEAWDAALDGQLSFSTPEKMKIGWMEGTHAFMGPTFYCGDQQLASNQTH